MLAVDVAPVLPAEPLVPAEVDEFLTWLAVERGRAPGTVEAYRRDLRRYAAWLDGRGIVVAAVVEADLHGVRR